MNHAENEDKGDNAGGMFAVPHSHKQHTILYRARWIAPEPGALIRDGALLCAGEGVLQCGRACDVDATAASEVVDLGDVIVLPGIINAHTHLELSKMAGLLDPTRDFVAWLRAMMAERAKWTEEDYQEATLIGIEQSRRAGVACVGNIATHPASDTALTSSWRSIRSRAFIEIIGPASRRRGDYFLIRLLAARSVAGTLGSRVGE